MIKRRCLSPKSPASMRCPELHRKNLPSTDCWLFLASYRTVVVASPFFLAKLGGYGRYSKHLSFFLKAFRRRKNKIGRINSYYEMDLCSITIHSSFTYYCRRWSREQRWPLSKPSRDSTPSVRRVPRSRRPKKHDNPSAPSGFSFI